LGYSPGNVHERRRTRTH